MSRQHKLIIGTPTHTGALDVWYVNSLVGTIRESEERGIRIDPVYMRYDSLIQSARNDLIALAIQGDYDEIVFIDSNIEWDPSWIFKLRKYSQDVVGGTYRQKSDDYVGYVLKVIDNVDEDSRTGLVKVAGLGLGFLKLSRKAIKYLWENSEPYTENGKNSRMVFDIKIKDGELIPEDLYVCQKLIDGGFDIWLDPHMCCNNIGTKKFTGNFTSWLEHQLSQKVPEQL